MDQHGSAPEPEGDAGGALPSGPAGSWYTWWLGDELPQLPPLTGLVLEPWREDDAVLARTMKLTDGEIAARRQSNNHPYCARMDGHLAGYGWSAHATVAIREVRLRFTLPPGDRYVWNCVTEPHWRGRGIYPRLLQYLLRREAPPAARFWIGHAPGNHASARGILVAGYQHVLDFDLLDDYSIRLTATGDFARAVTAARIMGLALPHRANT